MVKTAYFTDRNGSSNAFKRLELARTMLTFTEFDFTFFWEQSIDAGKTAKRTGQLPKATVGNAKAAILKCHPYVNAAANNDYSDIVLDCIIDYICRSERLSDDELWTRCISSKIPYEAAIFKRISEYKTFRGINEWTAVSTLQAYAKRKLEFIFGEGNENAETSILRKKYFDLAFSVAANECATPAAALPSVKRFNVSLMPGAVFTLNNSVTKSIYRRISDNLIKVPDFENFEKVHSDILQDKFAADAFKFISEMSVPLEPEMNLFAAGVAEIPDEIYSVSSLKAIIDLEFDLCVQNNIFFKKCETCGRYFYIDGDSFGDRFCDRVTGNGKTCTENFEALRLSIAAARRSGENLGLKETPPSDTFEQEQQDYLVNKEEFFPGIGERVQIKYSKPVREFTPAEVPDELERRGQKLYNSLYKRVGKAMSEQEFREWSQYLSNMKRNIKTGEGSAEQLSQFLDYSEKLADEIKRAVKDKKPMRREPVERLTRFAATTDNMHSIGTRRFPEYVSDENVTGEFIPYNAVDYDDETDNFAPFKPEIISTAKVLSDGSPFDEPNEPETVEIDGRQVTLTKPKWERVYRDEIDS
ncbi:MAG: hypothetical protein LBM87_08340 [Ruminococcus sp.]|nr:hypothetical protein [Ruminococcus sp.]